MKIEDFFLEQGLLEKNLDVFEYRDSQFEMAKLIEKAIQQNEHAIIEAATGIGKSFAYLLPFILYSIKNNEPIVISTNTKSLQQQMIEKDLPFLQNIFHDKDLDFKFKIFYGSNNYLCQYKTEKFLLNSQNIFIKHEDKKYLSKYTSNHANSGIRYDLSITFNNQVWQNLNRDSDLCLRKHCPFYRDCFYYKNLNELSSTNVIVVNHHVFFANIGSGYQILPPMKKFVWDEAHNIENIAAKFLAHVISEKELSFLFNQLIAFPSRISEDDDKAKSIKVYMSKISDINKLFSAFFDYYKVNFKHNTRILEEKLPDDIIFYYDEFIKYIKSFFESYTDISEEIDREINLFFRKLLKLENNLKFFINHNDQNYVYWVEKTGRKKLCELKFTPINISEYLKKMVFDVYESCILTSATLSTNKNFNFIKSRLGLDCNIENIYESPFDFKKQVMLYINQNISNPNQCEEYIVDLKKDIIKLLNYHYGKAFILFTSYITLNSIRKLIEPEIDYNLLVQNDKQFDKLIEEFKNDLNSVLLGTLSFWEGVDVPVKALSLVVIKRLPFDMPDDPLISARVDYIKMNGGNPFMEYQLPNAIILLKQGFGRLIRNSKDKGMVAILDSRIVKKSYGKQFINSLPECEIITDL